jgi:3-hydroxyisobutyrate dehydrogenase-like beta-hydroxyacid dehydrogenase
MGKPMASNLVRKGSSVIVCDVNADPVAALDRAGCEDRQRGARRRRE